jgi:hypothetical protein
MKILVEYLYNLQTEQLKPIGKGLEKIYKYSAKGLHHLARGSQKINAPDIADYLYKQRDEAAKIAQILKHNPTPENIIIVLKSLKYKVSVALIASSIILYCYKRYVRNWTKAGRYCKGTSGSHRTACLRRYKIKVLKVRLNDLEKAKVLCNKSKDLAKCKEHIDKKINKLKERVGILQTAEERRQDKY